MYFRGRPQQDEPAHATARGVMYGLLSVVAMAAGVLLSKRGLRETDPMTASAIRLAAAVAALGLFASWKRDLMPDLRRLCRPRVLRA